MLLDDLTLEVRDRTLRRVGQVTKPFLSMKATVRWCGVGEWELTLPGDHPMVGHLVADGSGVILLGPDGESTGVIFSGPTTTPKRKRDAQNPDGTFTFTGVTDEVHLLDALAFPSPEVADPSAQTRSNDTRTMRAESLMRIYVSANVANASPVGRRRGVRSELWLEPVDQARGIMVTKSPRFQNLLELLREIVMLEPSIGFRVVQVDAALQFQVLDSRDKRSLVRFDVDNGTLTSEEVQQSGPSLTYPIVAGQGEGTARTIIARTNAEAAAAETAYGRVIESFIDQRDTDVLVELQQSGDEALAEGRGGTSVKVIPADEHTMRFGVDWRPGDLVTIVVNGAEAPTAVTETALLIDSDGVRAGAALGDVSTFTKGGTLGAKVGALDVRVAQLERAGRPARHAEFSGTFVLNNAGAAPTLIPALTRDTTHSRQGEFAAPVVGGVNVPAGLYQVTLSASIAVGATTNLTRFFADLQDSITAPSGRLDRFITGSNEDSFGGSATVYMPSAGAIQIGLYQVSGAARNVQLRLKITEME